MVFEDKVQQAYSPEEAARILGKPVETIRRWLRTGELKGSKVGRSWFVPRSEIERIIQTQRGGEEEPDTK